jgi:hypothetical protein
MSYTTTRESAAELLEISTRTLDRYVKSGRIRAKRKGKVLYLSDEDITTIKNGEPELVRPTDRARTARSAHSEAQTHATEDTPDIVIFDEPRESGFTRKRVSADYRDLYEEVMRKMSEKDRIIQDLSYRAGHAESELKNSVSMIEYKKNSFLLESAKAKTEEDIKIVQAESLILREEALQNRFVLYILLSLVAVLLILCSFLLYFFL